MKRMKRGGGWAAIRYTLRMANASAGGGCGRRCGPRTPARPAPWAWAARPAACATKRATGPRSARNRLQAMVADMQEGLQPEFFATLQHRPAADPVAARAGVVRPAHAAALRRPRRHALPRHRLGRGPRPHRRQAARRSGPTRTSSTPAADRPTRPASCCSSSPGSTAPTTSTTAPTTATRPAASAWASSLGTGTATVTLEDVEHADLFFLIGGNPASNHPRLMRTLMNIRRRGGQVIVINPVKEVGLVNFSVPSDLAQPAVRLEDRQPVRPAAHRRRHRPADRRGQGACSNATPSTTASSPERPRASRRSPSRCAARPGRRSNAVPASTARRSSKIADLYCRRQERRLRLDDGHHASRARRRQRADDRQPGPAARHGRPARTRAACRSAATRNVQGIGSVGVDAEPQAEDPRQPRNAIWACSCRRRRAWTRWPACRRPTAARCARRSAWAATCSAAIPTPSSPAGRSAKLDLITYLSTTLNTGPCLGPRPRDADPAGAGPRRGTAADHAGIDVQLRPPQRRRPGRAARAAQRGGHHRRARRSRCSAPARRWTGRRCGGTATSGR